MLLSQARFLIASKKRHCNESPAIIGRHLLCTLLSVGEVDLLEPFSDVTTYSIKASSPQAPYGQQVTLAISVLAALVAQSSPCRS